MAEAKAKTDMEKLREDMEALRTDLAQLAQHVRSLSANSADAAKTEARARLDEFGGRLEGTMADLQRQGTQGVDTLKDSIRDRPLGSVLAALGIGLLVGRLLKRLD